MSPNKRLGQSELQPQAANFVLEQVSQRFDQFEAKFLRQSTYVVVQLDRGSRSVRIRAAFDDIRVQRSLGKKVRVFDLLCFGLEAIDESVSDATSFLLRFTDAGQRVQEPVFGVDNVQIGFEVFGELSNHQALFIFSEQPVVDQNARQLRSDRFVEQRGNHA